MEKIILKPKKEDLEYLALLFNNGATVRSTIYIMGYGIPCNALLDKYESILFDICLFCNIDLQDLESEIGVKIPIKYDVTDIYTKTDQIEPLEKIFFKLEDLFYGRQYTSINCDKILRNKGEDL